MKNELDGAGIRHYTNELLGIRDELCSPKCEFFKERDIKRIQLNWEKCFDNGKFGWWVGNMGIILTTQDGYEIGGEALVVWDGNKYVSGIHHSRFVLCDVSV